MGYKELLSQMVEKSNMTLRDIADMYERKSGKSIDPSYISKLQTGKQPPASDEVSKILSEILGGNPEELILEGYLEKAPELIRKFIIKTVNQLRHATKAATQIQFADDALIESYVTGIDSISDIQFIKEVAESEDNFAEFDDGTMLVEQDDGNQSQLFVNQGLEMPDDSMIPLIIKGARVTFKKQLEYKNGDIIIAEIPEEGPIVRKIIYNDDKVILLPENTKYETLILHKDEFIIGGRVNSVIVRL